MTLFEVAFLFYLHAAGMVWRLYLAYWSLYIQLKALGDL